jgi:hypothetical protein
MLLYEYFVLNSVNGSGKTIDPCIFRKVYGIDNAGEEYIGCVSNLLQTIEFYKYNLEVAIDKIRKLEYDLKERSNGITQVEA